MSEVKEATKNEQPKIRTAISMFQAGRTIANVKRVTGLSLRRMKELNLIADYDVPVPKERSVTGHITITRPLVEKD